jgi:hypothetical protein
MALNGLTVRLGLHCPKWYTQQGVSKTKIYENVDLRKRRPKTEDLRWVFVITKTKTHYENEDPSQGSTPEIFV